MQQCFKQNMYLLHEMSWYHVIMIKFDLNSMIICITSTLGRSSGTDEAVALVELVLL